MMINPYVYPIVIHQIQTVDGLFFEAYALDFPDIVEYADTWQEAYELAIDTIETALKILKEEFPTPTR